MYIFKLKENLRYFLNMLVQILTGFTPPLRTATLHRQNKNPDRHHSSQELGFQV
jgi:hypothetical protein